MARGFRIPARGNRRAEAGGQGAGVQPGPRGLFWLGGGQLTFRELTFGGGGQLTFGQLESEAQAWASFVRYGKGL